MPSPWTTPQRTVFSVFRGQEENGGRRDSKRCMVARGGAMNGGKRFRR